MSRHKTVSRVGNILPSLVGWLQLAVVPLAVDSCGRKYLAERGLG